MLDIKSYKRERTKDFIAKTAITFVAVPYLTLFGINTLFVKLGYGFNNWVAIIGLYLVAREIIRK